MYTDGAVSDVVDKYTTLDDDESDIDEKFSTIDVDMHIGSHKFINTVSINDPKIQTLMLHHCRNFLICSLVAILL